ncbi:MAG: alpha-galactosidase [Candidatus Cryptobacteroides sp.]
MNLIKSISTLMAAALTAISVSAQSGTTTCYATLEDGVFRIGNSLIERTFDWNGGNLKTLSLTNKEEGRTRTSVKPAPDFVPMEKAPAAVDGKFTTEAVVGDNLHPSFLKAVITYSLGGLEVRREYRVYDNVPAIACDTYLRGDMSPVSTSKAENAADRKNIEFAEDTNTRPEASLLDRLNFAGMHWRCKAVEFLDVTDWHNNLVTEREFISYHKTSWRGNLLFATDGLEGDGFFFLKEAPCSSVQLSYGGSDFITDYGHLMVTGLGLSPKDLSEEVWTKAYSCVLGVYGQGELSANLALRSYQKHIRQHVPDRDEMVMMNTWGDRSQDSKVNEKFCLEEIERAARLGITLFQIDDGWQAGKSPNSAVAKGSFKNIWDNHDYWTPDKGKYPRGLAPVVSRASELGVDVGLWFNPSVQNDFEDWEKDADAILGLYKEYGIRVFKIDGLQIPTKKAETNLRNLFDKVMECSGGEVVFNLDATAGRRAGYHYFNNYGNIFLENRYTDWGNYYPYWTLRNLWTLSKYVPAEKIQIEFLNKWRNASKYPSGDRFAPSGYSFDYLFAITMAAQPLAWMEASNLPEEAYSTASLINTYKTFSEDFHKGYIFPVGDQPSGTSWTGFQSICSASKGYVIIFREDNGAETSSVRTWFKAGDKISFKPLCGSGKAFTAKAAPDGTVTFSLDEPNSFAVYEYSVK